MWPDDNTILIKSFIKTYSDLCFHFSFFVSWGICSFHLPFRLILVRVSM